MIARCEKPLAELYETDETAWLDAMAELIRLGQNGDLDYPHLAEYLADMSRSDRREVKSRLRVLLAHILKWTYQPSMRTPSGRGSVLSQQHELQDLLESAVLRHHAEESLVEVYEKAASEASAETELPRATFPKECPWDLDRLMLLDVLGE